MVVDTVEAGPSRPATPPSGIEEQSCVDHPVKDMLSNKENQPHSGQSAESVITMDLDPFVATSLSVGCTTVHDTLDEGGSSNPAARTDQVDGESNVKAVEKSNLPGGQTERTETKAVDVKTKVIKPPRPSKHIVRREVEPKAGPSTHLPGLDTAKPKVTYRMKDVMIGEGDECVKRPKKGEEGNEGPAKKKRKVMKDGVVERSLSTDQSVIDSEGPQKVTTAKSIRQGDSSSSKPKPKKTKASNPPSEPSSGHSPHTPEITPSQFAELQGMVIESFAVSRASSLPASALYRTITDNRPALKSEHSQEEWVKLIDAALEDGRSESGMFGKVESSFKVCFVSTCGGWMSRTDSIITWVAVRF